MDWHDELSRPRVAWGLALGCLLTTAVAAFLARPEPRNPAVGELLVFTSPWILDSLAWTAVVLWVAYCAWAVWQKLWLGVLVAVALLCGGSGAGMYASFDVWAIQSPPVEHRGERYVAIGRGFLDSLSLLGREVSSSSFSTTHEVLAKDYREWDYGDLIVRARPPQGVKSVEVAPDGTIAVIADTAFRCGVGPSIPEDGRDPSPFFLLGTEPDAAGLDGDVERIARALQHPETRRRGPREEHLLAALSHRSAWVRNAARRLIDAGGPEIYPEATKRFR